MSETMSSYVAGTLNLPEDGAAVLSPPHRPTVGEIVHVVTVDGLHVAAVVVGLHDSRTADLYVFPTRARMAQITAATPYCALPRPLSWHYLEQSEGTTP